MIQVNLKYLLILIDFDWHEKFKPNMSRAILWYFVRLPPSFRMVFLALESPLLESGFCFFQHPTVPRATENRIKCKQSKCVYGVHDVDYASASQARVRV